MSVNIINEYEEIRSRAAARLRNRISKVYNEYPELKKIDDEMRVSGAKNVKSIIKEPQRADEFNKELSILLAGLNEKRKKFITENNIDPNFDKIDYECPICKDTGFLKNGKRCSCFFQKLINERYKSSNLGDILENENFDKFSFDYYSDIKNKDGISPLLNMQRIYKRANIFCDNFDTEEKGLLFYGHTGLGKTFMSSCIAKKLIDMGKTVLYLRASRLFSAYEDYRFNKTDDNIISDIYNCDLLIIDDLGTEAQNKNNFSFLFDLINERFESGKKIIINTNYNMSELNKLYSSRFTSRIYEHFLVYGFFGEDIRVQKLKN